MTLADRLVELIVRVHVGHRTLAFRGRHRVLIDVCTEVRVLIDAIEGRIRDLEAVVAAAYHAPTCETHTVRVGPDEQPDHPACTCPLGPALRRIR